MSERKLTTEQIDELFEFCRKHYVSRYDLQIELVDHLASSIEVQWKSNQDLPFSFILDNEFKKFGVYGFSKIKNQKVKELRRKYRKLLWKHTLEFYRWPKALLTLALTIILYMLFQMVDNDFWIIIPYYLIVSGFMFHYYYALFPKKYKIKTSTDQPFMLLDYLKGKQIHSLLIIQVPLHFVNVMKYIDYSFLNNQLFSIIISFFIIGFTFFHYVSLYVLPLKVKEHFTQQFPQFIIS